MPATSWATPFQAALEKLLRALSIYVIPLVIGLVTVFAMVFWHSQYEADRPHALGFRVLPTSDAGLTLVDDEGLVVENAGFGAAAAAPIARRVFDYLIAGLYPNPQDIAAVQLGQAGAPVGTPLKLVDLGAAPQ